MQVLGYAEYVMLRNDYAGLLFFSPCTTIYA